MEIIVEATCGLHSCQYFEILNLRFWGRSLVTKGFGFHSYSRGAERSKACRFQQIFKHRNMNLLLLFSIIYPYFNYVITMFQQRPSLNHCVKLQQRLGEWWISKLAFRVYSRRRIRNTSSALSWTRGPVLYFLAKCVIFWDSKLSILRLLACLCSHYIDPYITFFNYYIFNY